MSHHYCREKEQHNINGNEKQLRSLQAILFKYTIRWVVIRKEYMWEKRTPNYLFNINEELGKIPFYFLITTLGRMTLDDCATSVFSSDIFRLPGGAGLTDRPTDKLVEPDSSASWAFDSSSQSVSRVIVPLHPLSHGEQPKTAESARNA